MKQSKNKCEIKKELNKDVASQKTRSEKTIISEKKKETSLLVFFLMLTFISLLAYWGIHNNAFINMDDDVYITGNERVQKGISWENIKWAFSSLYFGFYYPLTWLSHMVDCEIYGLNAGGHHITSLIIHIINALLLFYGLHRMTKYRWRSFIVAVLFAIHPLHVEPVAWVSERKELLSTFFLFVGIIFYSLYVEKPTINKYILVFLSYLLGLMSKPMIITFPFMLLLLDYWPLERWNPFKGKEVKESDKKGREKKLSYLIVEKIPLFLLVPIFSFLTIYAQKKTGAVADFVSAPLSQRIQNAIISYIRYIEKMICPTELIPYYPFPMKQIEVGLFFSCLILFLGLTILFLYYGRKKRYLATGFLFYVGTLVPVIGIVQVGGQSMADRYSYVPLVGMFLVIVLWLSDIAKNRIVLKRALTLFLIPIIAVMMVVTRVQVGHWKDSATLFSYTLKVDPDNFFAHNSVGSVYLLEGKFDVAIKEFLEAIKNEPGYFSAHYNLAGAYLAVGKYEDAIEHYKISFIEKEDAEGMNNVGFALIKLKKYNEAVEWFKKSINIDPKLCDARINLADALVELGKTDEAIEQYKEALKINPASDTALNRLGIACVRAGRISDALENFKKAVELKPTSEEYHTNYGKALCDIGNLSDAIEEFEKALKINPDAAETLNAYGLALAKKEKFGDAIEKFKLAIRKDQNFVDAYINLGFAMLKMGDQKGAINNFEKALQLDPNSELALSDLKYAKQLQAGK